MTIIRDPRTYDLPVMALLINATREPHFHVTASELQARMEHSSSGFANGRLVIEDGDMVIGVAFWSAQPFDRPDRHWITLAIHPDHVADDTALQLLAEVAKKSEEQGGTSLWLVAREDYLDSCPSMTNLGFTEVHRTFGGGFFLSDCSPIDAPVPGDARLTPLSEVLGDPRSVTSVAALYEDVRHEKKVAPPTVTPAHPDLVLEDEDLLEAASFVAFDGADAAIGLSLVERSSVGAWSSVLAVRADRRREGIGRALVCRSLHALHTAGVPFLNTAGVRTDQAFLGLLGSAGARIEPDWVSYERALN